MEFEYRVKRGVFVKNLLFWLPIKRYQCFGCLKRYYVLMLKEEIKSTDSNNSFTDLKQGNSSYNNAN
jgi:hypothetical protein